MSTWLAKKTGNGATAHLAVIAVGATLPVVAAKTTVIVGQAGIDDGATPCRIRCFVI